MYSYSCKTTRLPSVIRLDDRAANGFVAERLWYWTCDLQVAGLTAGHHAVECIRGQIVYTHMCASVTKQYKFGTDVSWKVIVGLASHWPCIADTVVYPPMTRRWAPRVCFTGARHNLPDFLACTLPVWFGSVQSWKVMEFRKTIFQAWKVMENVKGHGKSWKMMIMTWNFYYCTEQFCKSDTTSFIKSNYEPFYLFRSTSKSQPNNIRRGEKCPSVRPSVRPQKVSSISMKFGI